MKIKIKTNLWTGIIIGIFCVIMLLIMPSQVREPMFDSGAPSPRIIPGVCLVGMLICSIILIIESLVFKKEKIIEFDWKQEKYCIVLIALMCAFAALIIYVGFIAAVVIVFPILLFYCGERKPSTYIVALVAGVGVYFLFKLVFHISLPTFPGFGG